MILAPAELIVDNDASVPVAVYPVRLPAENDAVHLKDVKRIFRDQRTPRFGGDTRLDVVLHGRHLEYLPHEPFFMTREAGIGVKRRVALVFEAPPVFHHISLDR